MKDKISAGTSIILIFTAGRPDLHAINTLEAYRQTDQINGISQAC
jgi:hypothetical protein